MVYVASFPGSPSAHEIIPHVTFDLPERKPGQRSYMELLHRRASLGMSWFLAHNELRIVTVYKRYTNVLVMMCRYVYVDIHMYSEIMYGISCGLTSVPAVCH